LQANSSSPSPDSGRRVERHISAPPLVFLDLPPRPSHGIGAGPAAGSAIGPA